MPTSTPRLPYGVLAFRWTAGGEQYGHRLLPETFATSAEAEAFARADKRCEYGWSVTGPAPDADEPRPPVTC